MLNQFSRTQLLLGEEAMEKLKNSRVAVFGIGGVGGYVCEALVRSGVGAFDLIDDDKVCLTNLNRQIIATRKTVGKYKADVMKERMLEINPNVDVRIHKCFFLPENADEFPFEEYDYVVDAVDTVTAKIELVMKCKEKNVPIMSSMGAGNKLDASSRHLQDKGMPSGESNASGAEKEKGKKIKGGIFRRTAEASDRGYVHQLQNTLYLPAGSRTQVYGAKRYSRQCGLRAVSSRTDHCRRGCKRSDHCKENEIA